jgi:NADPH2:quinone reductase
MKAIYLTQHFNHADQINLSVTEKKKPCAETNECLVRVASSGVNASDVLGALGHFHHAKLPRIPGRDFSGTIVDGDVDLIGKQIWGSCGAAGIDFDGTHAEYIIIPNRACAEIPRNMDLLTAGAQPLPYLTAYYSLVTRARIKARETVLVLDALGQAGKAAMSICKWKNCNAIAIVRGHAESQKAKLIHGWHAVDATDTNMLKEILALTQGNFVNVILNSKGNALWDDLLAILAPFGRIITIGAPEGKRETHINLFSLYRHNQDLLHVNASVLDLIANAHLLNELRTGFESGHLLPFEINPDAVFTFKNASDAYQKASQQQEDHRITFNLADE